MPDRCVVSRKTGANFRVSALACERASGPFQPPAPAQAGRVYEFMVALFNIIVCVCSWELSLSSVLSPIRGELWPGWGTRWDVCFFFLVGVGSL